MHVDNPDEERRHGKSRDGKAATVCNFVGGFVALAFLGWLCWLVTHLALGGLSEEGRANLAATGLLAASGVALSTVLAARHAASPFEYLAALSSAVKGMLSRW